MDRTIRFPEVEDLPESGNKTINFVHNQQLFWCLQDSRCWIKTPKRESPGVRVSKRIFRVVLLPSYNLLTRWPTLASGGKSSSWDLKWQRWIREICPWEVAVSPARSPPRWPQPSQLIHPRAGDSGQRDRLGPETTQDAGRDLPPPTATCADLASNGRARSGLATATETERGRRKNKEKSVEI